MTKGAARIFSAEFKLKALNRMAAGENVSLLARELGLRRKLLYAWRDHLRSGGPAALRTRGRPRKAVTPEPPALAGAAAPAVSEAAAELEGARRRIAELERKIGQQQVDLDFFRQALRHVRGKRRPSGAAGATASTPSSKR
jgi:transposase-like protein